jgi:hypothetical protein
MNNNLINLEFYEKKIFSQNGEDGIVQKLIDCIYDHDNTDKYFVEFGVQDGNECNTRILRELYKWNGLQMDCDNEDDNINLRKEFITKDNIISLFQKYNVPKKINLLSVDIDFNDFYCLYEILNNYDCDIIICEYNATHLPHEDKIVIYNENHFWDYTNYFGASLLSLYKLANYFNYSLVYCDKNGVNAFFVNKNIIKNKQLNFKDCNNINDLYKKPSYGCGKNGGHTDDWLNRKYITFDDYIHNNHNNHNNQSINLYLLLFIIFVFIVVILLFYKNFLVKCDS